MKLITIILLFISTLGLSQTIYNDSIDIYLFNLINEYRSENGLNELLLDTGMVKACQHHSRYLSFYDTLVLENNFAHHNEVHDTYSHLQEPITEIMDRANRYANIGSYVTENVFVNKYNPNFVVSSSYLDQNPEYKDAGVKFKKSIKLGKPDYEALAKTIIYFWKKSPGHNRALLDPKGYKGGVYTYLYKSQSGEYMSASTYLVTDDKWETVIQPIIDSYSH